MAILIDGSTPIPVTVTTVGPCTTASFTPPLSLILAICTVGNSTGSGAMTGAITDSIASSWGTNLSGFSTTAGDPRVELWALDAGASPSARTISLAGVGGTQSKGLCLSVIVLTGAQPKATCLGNTATGAGLTVSLNVGTAGSAAFFAQGDNGNTTLHTAAASCTLIKGAPDATNGESFSSARLTNLSLSTGAQAIGIAGAVTAQNSAMAWEIKQATASGIIIPRLVVNRARFRAGSW